MLKGLKALGSVIAGVFEEPVVQPIGLDRTLRAIGLDELNNKGYINLPDSEFPIDPDFYSKAKAEEHVTGAYIRHAHGWDPVISTIHPLFLPRKWKDVSKEDYELILPSIKLASRFLDEPQVLTYVKGFLARKLELINDAVAIQNAQQPLYMFQKIPLEELTSRKIGKPDSTWSSLWDLKDCLTLQFTSKLPNGCVAVTGPGSKSSTVAPGRYSGAKSANILLSVQFLRVFQRNLEASQYSEPWEPGSHNESALLRTQFAFAVTLVHEVMHALWITSTPPYGPIATPSGTPEWIFNPVEPFFRDGRMNELGSCWEDNVFGGMIHMLGRPTGAIMPYGLAAIPFPGLNHAYPGGTIDRLNPRKWGIEWQTEYPLEMNYIRRMFTSELWDEVHRYGIKRLRRKKKLGLRRYVDEKAFEALAPGEAVRGIPPSPTGSVASMDAEEDDEKGVVRRGSG